MPAVTVIIPTFNRSRLLIEALTSVMDQTFRDSEIVVVDDGSTDDTQEALVPFANRIRYVRKANGGEASARNRGIQEARARRVAFLDSDDRWEPAFLETTMQHLDRHPELGLVATACSVVPEGHQRRRIRRAMLQGDLLLTLFSRNFITASAVLINRDCFAKVGFFNEQLDQATDYDMWLKIARAYPIAFLNKPLCRWRRHEGNSSRDELRHRQCVLKVIEANCDPSRIPQALYQRRRSRLWVSLGRVYLGLGRIEEGNACFREAIALTPYRFRPWRYLWFTRALRTLRTFPLRAPMPRRSKTIRASKDP
jgi:glycosyltransferase involved in cell wall biosynthesis